MTSDNRTPDQIERDIAEERAQLSGSINDLQKKFSVEGIVGELGDIVRSQSGDLGRAVSQTVGRNPAAVALVGAGLAWLILGSARVAQTEKNDKRRRLKSRRHVTSSSFHEMKQHGRQEGGPFNDGDRYWYGEDNGFAGISDDLQQDGMFNSTRAEDGGLRLKVVDAAGTLKDAASGVASKLLHGTEGFSEDAKARILSARKAAHDARIASEVALAKSRATVGNLFEEQPLVIGALAVALGAAVGGALPRTRTEDDALGDTRDALFAEAQAVFRAESSKAMAVVKTAAQTARTEIHQAGEELADLLPDVSSVSDAISERVSDAASHVIDEARIEADRQRLGTQET